MPFKKVYRRRPKRFRKRRAFTPKQKTLIKKIAEKRGELKHYHVTGSAVSTNSAIIVNLSGASQGDAITNRDGDRMEPSSILLRGTLLRDSATTAGSWDSVRLVLIQWHQDSAVSTPTASDIFEDTTQSTIHLTPLIADKSKRSMFTLLADRQWQLQDRANSYDSMKYQRQFWIKSKLRRKIFFNAGATSARNHVYLFVIGTQTSSTEDTTLTYQSLLRFRDI